MSIPFLGEVLNSSSTNHRDEWGNPYSVVTTVYNNLPEPQTPTTPNEPEPPTPETPTPGTPPLAEKPAANPNLIRFSDLYENFLRGDTSRTNDNGDLSLVSTNGAAAGNSTVILLVLAAVIGGGYYFYKRKKHNV